MILWGLFFLERRIFFCFAIICAPVKSLWKKDDIGSEGNNFTRSLLRSSVKFPSRKYQIFKIFILLNSSRYNIQVRKKHGFFISTKLFRRNTMVRRDTTKKGFQGINSQFHAFEIFRYLRLDTKFNICPYKSGYWNCKSTWVRPAAQNMTLGFLSLNPSRLVQKSVKGIKFKKIYLNNIY